MSSKQRRGIEDRQAKRYSDPGEVTVVSSTFNTSFSGRILNLSTGGCLLALPGSARFEAGTSLEVSIHSGSAALRAKGRVRHFDEEQNLVGISFDSLGRRGLSDLLELIADLESVAAASASRQTLVE